MPQYDTLDCPFCGNWIPEEIVLEGGDCPRCDRYIYRRDILNDSED